MNIHDLEAFIAVVETGSIVGASARLHLTQPGISRRIQNLEERLGAPLLDRQSKPFKPTASGREAYEHGRRLLRSFDDLKAGVSSDGEIKGEFRLGILPYLSDAALAVPLDRLRGEFPKLTLKITAGWSPRMLEQVARSELDAAALCLPNEVMPPEDLVSERLLSHPVLLVAASGLGVPKRAGLEELSRFPWVLNESGCGFRNYLRTRFEAASLPFMVGVEALSAELRMSLIARGHGIGLITEAALMGGRWRKKVQIIEPKGFRPEVRSWLVHRAPAGRLARPIALFRDALLMVLKQKDSLLS
jgi:DNA-binding transcriptional LysR family regulator